MSTQLASLGTTSVRRWLSFVATAAILGGLLALGSAGPVAQAAADTGSAVAVKWAGGNDRAIQPYQPDHAALTSDGHGKDAGSGHWDDFKNLTIAASKTQGLDTEVVTVTASGMAGTLYNSMRHPTGNFLQVFQCWGPDPLAPEFAETCQYGSRIGEGRNIPFRAVNGDVSDGPRVPDIRPFFTPSTSNELPFVPVSADGTATVGFEVQSAAAQPYLGCGDPDSAAGARCWLVVVPRGIHSSNRAADDDRFTEEQKQFCGADPTDTNPWGSEYGDVVIDQDVSPMDPSCAAWENRIVVPLEFEETTMGCAVGAAERRLVGSELLAPVFSSWQRGLCRDERTRAFNLATNSGDLTRAQLLAGQSEFVVVSAPVAADSIGTADPALIEDADLAYAPVANAALTFAFVIADGERRHTDIKLTPRLLAKMLTQSYVSDVPRQSVKPEPGPEDSASYASRTVLDAFLDPEWRALGNPEPGSQRGPTMVVFGPQGDDAIRQLWAYIQADADAAAFLRGEPDPWGMSVNPYYLPAGHPKAAGGGLPVDLARQSDGAFRKADQTLSPPKEDADRLQSGKRLDSVTYNPYSIGLEANAIRIFRGDARITNEYDPNAGMEGGAFRSNGVPSLASGWAILGPASATAAAQYQLGTAQLASPLSSVTSADTVQSARRFIVPTDDSLAAAVAGLTVDGGLSRVDPARLPADAYPLTVPLHAAVNFSAPKLTGQARADYAALLDYAAGTGQVRGEAPGQLPVGYAPLTEAQRDETRGLAALLRSATDDDDQPGTTESQPAGVGDASAGAADPSSVVAAPGGSPTQTGVTADARPDAVATASVATPAQAAIGASLAAALAGCLGAPLLLRRQREGG